MFCLCVLSLFIVFLQHWCYCLEPSEGWNYINLHCRDNENKPVDWWYIYKPPSSRTRYLETGRNFSFITADSAGSWQPSRNYITANSMLQHTLSPLFRPTYVDYLAVLAYEERASKNHSEGSTALGVMLADEMGGLWIGHTIPGFPDFSSDRPKFPEKEHDNGHMIMCLTVDLVTLNEFAAAIKQAGPKLLKLKIPNKVQTFLPKWELLKALAAQKLSTRKKKITFLNFKTRDNSLRGLMMSRSPGESYCLYETFARNKEIVLDIYGHTEHHKSICKKKYSLRNINSISLKYPEREYIIENKIDKANFGVSATTEMQLHGKTSYQHWTCTGKVEKQADIEKGGLVVCVHHYNVWLPFNNLKIKEPNC